MEEKQYTGQKKIENFILLKEIGHGAFGKVFLSKDTKLSCLTAIKVLNRKKLKDNIDTDKFLNRIKVFEKLNHKNITRILDKQKTSHNYYIELEYCNGPDLLTYLKKYKEKNNKSLSEAEVQKIIIQLVEGIEYLHKNKIIHRDLKLENILIHFNDFSNSLIGTNISEEDIRKKTTIFSTKNPSEVTNLLEDNFTIKICDFGFAREVDENNEASTVLGTPIIMAPDILKMKDHYGTEADLWSLGVCVYQLLIGKIPFYRNNVKNLIKEIMNGSFDYPKEVEISFEAISFINGLLQFNPKKRMTFDKIKRHPFIAGDPKNFHQLQLNLDVKNNKKLNNLMVNSKEDENLIWLIYSDGTQVGYDLDKIDDDFLKVEFNEDYLQIKGKESNEEDNEEMCYSFIDLRGNNNDDFLIYEGFSSRKGEDDWEIISATSEEEK